MAVAAKESVSQAATPAIRANCPALSAQMFPLAPLKVADITRGLDDISRGFYYVKIRFRPKMTNISGWMIYPWMIEPHSTVIKLGYMHVNKVAPVS